MAKRYLRKSVYDAALERVAYIFNEFDNILVAFSGGKDSAVCLNLCYDYAKNNGMLHKMAMYHLDYEAQYQMTTDFVEKTFQEFSDIKRYWLCLPVKAQCVCRMDGGTWTPWEQSKRDIWVRDMPDCDFIVNESNCPFEFSKSDYEVQDNFCKWFEKTHGKTAVIIGIRADESLNRFRAVASDKASKYKGTYWINQNKAYIIYDWSVRDIWIYNGKFNKSYNRLYDLYYQAGLSVEQMRVASPFNDCAANSLKLYKVIEPQTWGKMISRVNGVNFTALYGGTTAMGWKSITLPKGHTWKSYLKFLLSTLDEKTRQHYELKFKRSIEFWEGNGGALDKKTINEIEKNSVSFKNHGAISKQSSKDVITFDEYPDDLDVSAFQTVPSYKRMCVCILKNDYYCKYMGFAQTKQELEKRRRALEKYKNL